MPKKKTTPEVSFYAQGALNWIDDTRFALAQLTVPLKDHFTPLEIKQLVSMHKRLTRLRSDLIARNAAAQD